MVVTQNRDIERAKPEVETSAPSDTRSRILSEAAALFRRQGYRATSTRQIAQAVDIKQPSLFYHFANKKAILDELFSISLDQAVLESQRAAAASGSPARRLYSYLVWDLTTLLNVPLSLSELYTSDILRAPEFASWAAKLKRLYGSLEAMIEQGIALGEFAPCDPKLARMMISAVTISHIQYADEVAERDAGQLARRGARFALSGLMAEGAEAGLARIVAEHDASSGF